jgi:hypothetical protein
MTMKFGGTGNLNLKSFNANPRTGVPMPKFGSAQTTAIPAGTLPKRSRGGGAGDPLARIPGEVRTAFQGLKAPQVAFRVLDGGAEVQPVDEHGEQLKAGYSNGDIHFTNVRGQAVELKDVLFRTEGTDENPEGDTYTADGVEPMEVLDRIPVEGDPQTLNKLYQAMQIFNKATGKQLRMLLDRNVLDDKGNIITQHKVIWRTA